MTRIAHPIRLKSWSIALLLAILAVTIPLATLNPTVNALATITWNSTTNYPTNTQGASCVTYGGYDYCVGGYTGSSYLNTVYYAPLSSSGVGTWTLTKPYPKQVSQGSCVTSSGYIYCIGGLTTGLTILNNVYYASLSSSGVGTWTSTTSYPTLGIEAESCVAYAGYVYCVGGNTGSITNTVYYAPLSSSGVGAWASTTVYPTTIEGESCVVYAGYVDCVGGHESGATYPTTVYYGPLSPGGITSWTSTTSYPSGTFEGSCVVYASYIYCLTGIITSSTNYAPLLGGGLIGAWETATNYPATVEYTSCALNSAYVYCVGASSPTKSVYYAQLSAVGGTISSWSLSATTYLTPVDSQSCVVYAGYIYCVGGYNNAVDYAPLSSSGVGTWTPTTSYPTNILDLSCVVSAGYIYCVGGNTGSSTSAVYYAPLSSSGVGVWTSTTIYPTPIRDHSCVAYAGYVYCVGGYTGAVDTNAVYYAPLSSSGVGTWTQTTNYLAGSIIFQSCVVSAGYIYCVGGNAGSSAVYYAPLSSSGVGAWTQTTNYPTNIDVQSCVVNAGYVYCVAGSTGSVTNAVYYAQLSVNGGIVSTWSPVASYVDKVSSESCVANAGYIYCVGGSATNAVYFAHVLSPVVAYGIDLVVGWNLISLPLIPSNPSITTVLSSLIQANDLVIVWAHSGSSWIFFTPPNGGTLKSMVDGQGYWVMVNTPITLQVSGYIVPPQGNPPSYSLNAGWNLVGFKPPAYIGNETVSQYLSNLGTSYLSKSVLIYDNVNQAWEQAKPSTMILPGQALWVDMSSAATFTPA